MMQPDILYSVYKESTNPCNKLGFCDIKKSNQDKSFLNEKQTEIF